VLGWGFVQPSLTGLFRLGCFFPGLASWAIFSRPFGTGLWQEGLNLVVGAAKAVVGLRPSFSSHVRWGERGAPVDSLWRLLRTASRPYPSQIPGSSRKRLGRTPECGKSGGALQIPPLRYPGFPVELGGVDEHHAPFPYRKAHTLPCPVQRGRKSGYAPVGVTKGRATFPWGGRCQFLQGGAGGRVCFCSPARGGMDFAKSFGCGVP
jgi:hypothetical protein